MSDPLDDHAMDVPFRKREHSGRGFRARQQATIHALQSENAALKARLVAIEQLLQQIKTQAP